MTAPKSVVDDKSLVAVQKEAEHEALIHEQELDEQNRPKSVGGLKPEVGVTVEWAGKPGVEVRVKPDGLDEDNRPKTSTDTGPIAPRTEPSVKVVASPAKKQPKAASRASGK